MVSKRHQTLDFFADEAEIGSAWLAYPAIHAEFNSLIIRINTYFEASIRLMENPSIF